MLSIRLDRANPSLSGLAGGSRVATRSSSDFRSVNGAWRWNGTTSTGRVMPSLFPYTTAGDQNPLQHVGHAQVKGFRRVSIGLWWVVAGRARIDQHRAVLLLPWQCHEKQLLSARAQNGAGLAWSNWELAHTSCSFGMWLTGTRDGSHPAWHQNLPRPGPCAAARPTETRCCDVASSIESEKDAVPGRKC